MQLKSRMLTLFAEDFGQLPATSEIKDLLSHYLALLIPLTPDTYRTHNLQPDIVSISREIFTL